MTLQESKKDTDELSDSILIMEVPNGIRHRYTYDFLENRAIVHTIDEDGGIIPTTQKYEDSVLRICRDIMNRIQTNCQAYLNMLNQEHVINRIIVDFVLVKRMKSTNGRVIYISDIIMGLKTINNPKMVARYTAPTELLYLTVKDLQPDSLIFYGSIESPELKKLVINTIMGGFIPSMINKHQFAYSFMVCRNHGSRRIRRFPYRNTVNMLRAIVQRDILEEGMFNIISFIENGALLSQLPTKVMDSGLTAFTFRDLRKNITLLYENIKYGNILSIFLLEACGFIHLHDINNIYTCKHYVEFLVSSAKTIGNICLEKHSLCTPESEDLLALTDKIVNIDTIYDKVQSVATA